MTNAITYSLTKNATTETAFYTDLQQFTNIVITDGFDRNAAIIDEFSNFITAQKIEKTRTREEYLLELLMLGILWQNYIHNAQKTNYISKFLVKRLYDIRTLNPSAKPTVDVIRGILAYELLEHNLSNVSVLYNLKTFENLTNWLDATGEFTEETLRLKTWISFLKTKNNTEILQTIEKSIDFAQWFSFEGRIALGQYVANVSKFRNSKLTDYKHKEDYFFVGRRENEYLLNMVGAEIMNRSLFKEFESKPNKALLLPTCMRNQPYDGCKAVSDGKELVCKSCFAQCNIGKIATEMKKHNVTTYLIPHSSTFSKFLAKWQNNNDTALIGVACVLNLLTGGYEMTRLGIASQCVFLNYSSCKKHWDENGEPTNLDIETLKRIVKRKSQKTQ